MFPYVSTLNLRFSVKLLTCAFNYLQSDRFADETLQKWLPELAANAASAAALLAAAMDGSISEKDSAQDLPAAGSPSTPSQQVGARHKCTLHSFWNSC